MIKKTDFERDIDRLKTLIEQHLDRESPVESSPQGYKICKSCARDVVVGEKQCICGCLWFIDRYVRKVV